MVRARMDVALADAMARERGEESRLFAGMVKLAV
jgi:hypothetical protein